MSANDAPKLEEMHFTNLIEVMQAAGVFVVDGIIKCVSKRVKPNGMPQKQNAASTIAAKGHDHPIFEKVGRFMKRITYLVTPRSETSVVITIARAGDSEIAAHLNDMGYEFFGITDEASEKAYEAMDKYLCDQVKKTWGGRR
jgi:hypothetical protein